ncbi:MAG: helix-turn-helix domain-containing protein [Nanoarchaeota archaeon]|nr:helix-turn-helix domain-containing protein [Nanoarchaeota archaeon]
MWVAKIKFSGKGTLIGSKAVKHKVNLFGFPLSYYYEKKWIIVQIAVTIFGNEKNKKEFIRDLKKEKRTSNLELKNDFLIGIIKEPIYIKCIYNKDIIHIDPAFISDKGYELINVGSFDRKRLMDIVKLMEERYKGRLLSIQQKKIKSISIMRVHPELTEKQKKAMELAIKHGYYHSPRKIDLKQLTKLAGLSFSTYQVHLRKAEEKLIPYFFEE